MPGCTQCASGTFRTACTACDTSNGWFSVTVSSGNVCQECPDNCLSCSSKSVCTTCKSKYWIQDGLCRPCPATCETCADLQSCLTTSTDFYLTPARKTAICPTYCDTAAGSCEDGIGCLKCATGSIINNGTGLCDPCPANCNICSSTTKCITCASNYYQNSTYICRKCPANCTTCSNDNTCQTCMMYYYKDTDNKCQNCPTNCKQCTNSTTCDSSQCVDGYYLSSGLC